MLIETDDPATLGARLAHRFHGNPADRLDVVAITGTNGKTTVAWFVRALLQAAGRSCGLVGTIETDDGRTRAPSTLTTPSACDLAAALGRMLANGCDSVVLEASSHALHQARLVGVTPDVALFTNLSGDHLDYHGTLESYAAAKASLFEGLAEDGVAVVNADDPAHERMVRDTAARVLRCSTAGADAEARVRVDGSDRTGMDLAFEGACGNLEVRVPLVGRHNAENLLLALSTIHALGIDPTSLVEWKDAAPSPAKAEDSSSSANGFAWLIGRGRRARRGPGSVARRGFALARGPSLGAGGDTSHGRGPTARVPSRVPSPPTLTIVATKSRGWVASSGSLPIRQQPRHVTASRAR